MMDFLPTDSARLEDFVQELENMRDDGFTIDDIPEYILETYGGTMNSLNELSLQKRSRPLITSITKVYSLDDMIELVEELARESEEKERMTQK